MVGDDGYRVIASSKADMQRRSCTEKRNKNLSLSFPLINKAESFFLVGGNEVETFDET